MQDDRRFKTCVFAADGRCSLSGWEPPDCAACKRYIRVWTAPRPPAASPDEVLILEAIAAE
jgi:hypothetical protein